MSTLSTTVVQRLDQVQAQFESLANSVSSVAAAGPIAPQATLSNTRLLLDALHTVYAEVDKATFLPHQVDSQILAVLTKLGEHLTQFQGSQHPTHAGNVVAAADQLYAASLQYGLITFGFDQKELSELLSDLRARRKYARRVTEDIGNQSRRLLSAVQKATDSATTKIDTETGALRDALTAAIDACQKERQAIQADAETMRIARKEFDEKHTAVVAMAEALTESATTATAAASQVVENERLVRTELETVRDLRAKAKAEMDEIKEFYGEIEAHQQAMRETQKDAAGKFNDLKATHESVAAELQQRTAAIVSRNEELQGTIKEHLRRAVGASLFSAFDMRRRGLSKGKWLWAGVMLLSVGAGGTLSWWLANSLGAGPGVEPAFFVKLSAVIPVTFAIIFSAKQYSNERRTEEEYAFKSAISVSLEPYKDLLHRMKEGGHEAESAFVQDLLMEVFDNPVKRIYLDASATSQNEDNLARFKSLEKLLAMSRKLDPDKARKMLEMARDIYGISLHGVG